MLFFLSGKKSFKYMVRPWLGKLFMLRANFFIFWPTDQMSTNNAFNFNKFLLKIVPSNGVVIEVNFLADRIWPVGRILPKWGLDFSNLVIFPRTSYVWRKNYTQALILTKLKFLLIVSLLSWLYISEQHKKT